MSPLKKSVTNQGPHFGMYHLGTLKTMQNPEKSLAFEFVHGAAITTYERIIWQLKTTLYPKT